LVFLLQSYSSFEQHQATVNHIYRFYIFAHVMNRAENNGLIVVRGNTVRLVSGLTATTEFKAPVSRGAPKIDPLVNTTVRVSIGQFKGMVGLVREVAGNDVVSFSLSGRRVSDMS
jgi:transcription elongation factor